MAIRYRAALDRDPLTYAVRATDAADGSVWYPPVGATFEVAYLTGPQDPEEADWKDGAFGLTRSGGVIGYAIVGPGSAIGALAKGAYFEWYRLTDSSIGVVSCNCVGRLVIE